MKEFEKYIDPVDYNACKCDGDTHRDEHGNSRCSNCDKTLSIVASRRVIGIDY